MTRIKKDYIIKSFNLDLVELEEVERIDGPEGRYYKTPSGLLYPSVTTVLGAMADKAHLEIWRNRIGFEEADRYTAVAGRRGSAVHDLCERYVKGDKIDPKKEMSFNMNAFRQIKKVLDKHVDDVRCIEGMLYSDKLKVAGSTDLIASFDNRSAITDYKTSAKEKSKEWIHSYFHQTSLYAYAWYERTGLIVKDIVIIMAIDTENEAQVFHEKVEDWLPEAVKITKEYHKIN